MTCSTENYLCVRLDILEALNQKTRIIVEVTRQREQFLQIPEEQQLTILGFFKMMTCQFFVHILFTRIT